MVCLSFSITRFSFPVVVRSDWCNGNETTVLSCCKFAYARLCVAFAQIRWCLRISMLIYIPRSNVNVIQVAFHVRYFSMIL